MFFQKISDFHLFGKSMVSKHIFQKKCSENQWFQNLIYFLKIYFETIDFPSKNIWRTWIRSGLTDDAPHECSLFFHANFRLTVVRSMNLLYRIWEGDRSIIPEFTKSLCLYEYSELWRMQALRNQLKNDSYINFDE